jgi:DNA-binding MarR family transcriptional regulator
MSAAVKRLIRLGYIDQRRHAADARSIELRLTMKGAAAMRESSVLEAGRVEKLLAALSSPERRAALDGLALLAQAARHVMEDDRDA